jgi:nucleotide-binding universal stress UspA family protein
MKTLLAPIDFSAVSINAASYAARLAHHLGAELELLHVLEVPVVYGEIPLSGGSYEHLMEHAKTELRDLAHKLARPYDGELSIRWVIKTGAPLYEIIQHAHQQQPWMVVMATRGLGQLEQFLLGSTTLSTIKECDVPVLVIPEGHTFTAPHKIGLASDLKNVAERTPEHFIHELLQAFNAELYIVHNNANYQEYEPEVMQESLLLDTMFSRDRHRFHFIHEELTEEAIIRYAEAEQLDWLMVMPRKHGFFDNLFGHQHTRTFVLHSKLPVLVLNSCAFD